MIFKKVNLTNEKEVLEQSQEILNQRLSKNQIDSKKYIDESLKIKAKIEKINQKELGNINKNI